MSFAHIIVDLCILCKKLLSPRLHHRPADLPQTHLRNIAGGDTQCVDGAGRVKGVNALKILRQYIGNGRQGQASHQHIGNAALQRPPVCDLYIQRIQFLQHTAAATIQQIPQVVPHVIRHRVAAGGQYGVRQGVLFGQRAEGGLQRLDDLLRIGRFHRPNGDWPRDGRGVGICDVKVVLQPPLAVGFINDSNAGSARIDPPAKLPIPLFQLQHRRSIRPLGIDQDLLVERAFIVIAGRPQKACPAFIVAGQLCQCAAIQLCDELKFACQGIASFLKNVGRIGSRLPCFAPFFQLLQSLQKARHFLKAHSIHIISLSLTAAPDHDHIALR